MNWQMILCVHIACLIAVLLLLIYEIHRAPVVSVTPTDTRTWQQIAAEYSAVSAGRRWRLLFERQRGLDELGPAAAYLEQRSIDQDADLLLREAGAIEPTRRNEP